MSLNPRHRAVAVLDSRTRRVGNLLVGGSPTTVVRLSDVALELIDDNRVVIESQNAALLADRLVTANLAHVDHRTLPAFEADRLMVVIPIKDRAIELRRLLTALDGRFAVMVVDDGSSDPVAIAECAADHGAAVIRLDENVGPAAARSTGLRHVASDVVAFVDSDVTVDPEALLLAARHFADPAVGAVAPRVRGRQSGANTWYGAYEESSSSLDLRDRPTTVRPYARVAWLPSACLLVRVDVAGAGFDESMRVGEDVDFVWRAIRDGHRVVYEPAAEAWHDCRATFKSWWARKAYYGTGGAALHRRHGDLVAPAVLTPIQVATAAVLLAQRGWSVPVAGIAVAFSARQVRHDLPEGPGRNWLAVTLAGQGATSAMVQVSALCLRHHWPIAAAVCVVSKRARRAVAVMAIVDGILDYHGRGPRVGLLAHTAGRRVDDLAYGAGLWWGALRDRELGVLKPRVRWRSEPRSGVTRQ